MRPPIRAHRPQGGFTLLEAIVALTILAAVGLVLFDWIRQNLEAASRIRAEHARVELLIQAQALVASVNPGIEPEGTRSLEGLTVGWTSRRVAGPNALFGEVSAPGQPAEGWQVALYELTVRGTAAQPDGPRDATTVEFKALRTGTLHAGSGRTLPP